MNYELRVKVAVTVSLSILFGLHGVVAQAAGIEVSPARLEISVGSKSVVSRIEVKNPTSDVQLYEVSLNTDDSNIVVRPKSFTIQAGGFQEVQLSVQPKPSAEFSGEVQIVARPLAATSNEIGSGVKLPLVIHYDTSRMWDQQQYIVWIIVGIVLATLVLLRRFSRKTQKLS